MRTKNILVLGVIIVTSMLFASCKKESVNPAQPSSSSGTSMRVKMTDSPGEYADLNVNIVSVQAYLDGDGWVTLNQQSRQVSVISLTNGITTDLSFNTSIKSGVYSKIKLVFGDNNTISVKAISSGGPATASGTFNLTWLGPKEVEIPIHEEIAVNGSGEVILDFDVIKSIKEELGQYVITPVITEVKDMTTGIKGTLQAGAHAAVEVSNGLFHSSTYADANGNFIIHSCEPGTYTMKIFSTAENIAQGAQPEITLQNIIVTDGEITQVGSVSLK